MLIATREIVAKVVTPTDGVFNAKKSGVSDEEVKSLIERGYLVEKEGEAVDTKATAPAKGPNGTAASADATGGTGGTGGTGATGDAGGQ